MFFDPKNRFAYIKENFSESTKLSSIQRKISLIYGQREDLFELKKVLMIKKNFFVPKK